MADNRSFTDYIASTFSNQLWEAAENYLRDEWDPNDYDFRRLRRAGNPEIEDVKVEHVWVEDRPEMQIQFDVAISVELTVPEDDHHYDDYEEETIWLMVRCEGDLDKDLEDFNIFEVSSYNGKNRKKNPLDDSLVPVISREQLEKIAEGFLRRHYKKALLEPCWVDPIELAEGMGLTIRRQRITKDGSVFGRSYFRECESEIYDKKKDEIVTERIPAKTVLVDPSVAFMRNLGAYNNTIVHECVHWDLHKKAFALARLYDKNLSNVSCKVSGGVPGHEDRDAVGWMEWQANALAPKIQMPAEMFKKRINTLISQVRRETGDYDIIDIIEKVIDHLVVDFGVSRLAAKIRMVDVGYEEAMGAFIFVDGRYVKPHKATPGRLDRNETFSISARDAVYESFFNPNLKAILAEKPYIYVDSHFVLNLPLYVEKDAFGDLRLTHYARNHMDECCLAFSLKLKSDVSEHYHTECYLNRDDSSDIVFEAHFSPKAEKGKSHEKMIKDYNNDLLNVIRKLPKSFSGTLNALIEWSEMTEEQLSSAADISVKTIQRLRNEEPDNVTIETVVQLCIGMKLPPPLSACLVEASKKGFVGTEQHIMYQFILNSYYWHSIYECNDLLESQGCKKLGKQNRTT